MTLTPMYTNEPQSYKTMSHTEFSLLGPIVMPQTPPVLFVHYLNKDTSH